MFLLVSGRHVGAHPDGRKNSVSIQISIKLGKTLKNCCGLNLGEGLCIFTFFLPPGSGIYLLNGFDFYFDLYLQLRDTENQQ